MRKLAIVLVPVLVLVLVIGTIACEWDVGTIACNEEEGEAEGTPTIPNAPSGLTATAQTFSMVVLGWQDNSDNEDSFIIVRKTGAGGKYSIRASVGAGVTSYRDTGLSEETTYYYRVRAHNDAGGSTYSNEYSATTPRSIPEYHAVGTSVQGQKQSLSIVAVTKTDHYCTLPKCLAPPGTAFVAVFLSITNHHSDILIVRQSDFNLRDSATRNRYILFDYPGGVGALLGEPLPNEQWLSEGQTVSGVVVYNVPETALLSEMEVVYVLDHKEHAWQP